MIAGLHWFLVPSLPKTRFDQCNPSGSAADAGHEAAARVRGLRVRRMTVLCPFRRHFMGRPVPRPINAQRVARCDHYRACNCLPPQKLRREIQ